jgi:hypothetical protein
MIEILFLLLGIWLLITLIRSKGAIGESKVRSKIGSLVKRDNSDYHQFDNVILKTLDGTTEIDHIIISSFGIFVIETKNFKGWIFGGENQKQWTQSLKRSYRFYSLFNRYTFQFKNPLHQNYKHVKAIQAFLNVEPKFVFNVVVFVGNSRFMTDMPVNVMRLPDFLPYIKSHTRRILSNSKVEEFCQKLEDYTRNAPFTHGDHMRNIKGNIVDPICPKCGIKMVLRTARAGDRQFWGCSNYPSCKTIKSLA